MSEPGKWTITMIKGTLGAMSARKAPGMDEWCVQEMRIWPDCLLNALADIYNKVEAEGKWPCIGEPFGVLLEKGGTAKEADKRPIWILPMAYRVWASARAKELAKWRMQWPGKQALEGADLAAWRTALILEAARNDNQEYGLVAFDWQKA